MYYCSCVRVNLQFQWLHWSNIEKEAIVKFWRANGKFTNQGHTLYSRVSRAGRGVWGCGRGRGGAVWHPFPLFWHLSIFWQNVSVKFPDQMLSVYLEYFIIKTKCRILSISSPAEIKLLPTMTAFKEVI